MNKQVRAESIFLPLLERSDFDRDDRVRASRATSVSVFPPPSRDTIVLTVLRLLRRDWLEGLRGRGTGLQFNPFFLSRTTRKILR